MGYIDNLNDEKKKLTQNASPFSFNFVIGTAQLAMKEEGGIVASWKMVNPTSLAFLRNSVL